MLAGEGLSGKILHRGRRAHGDGRINALQSNVPLPNDRHDVVGDRPLVEQCLDLRRGSLERGWVGGRSACRGRQYFVGKVVLADESAIGQSGDVKARRNGQARRLQPRQRGPLAARPARGSLVGRPVPEPEAHRMALPSCGLPASILSLANLISHLCVAFYPRRSTINTSRPMRCLLASLPWLSSRHR